MTVFDLDANEIVEAIKLNWREYLIWDIPDWIIKRILSVKTGIFRRDLITQLKPIARDILKIKNDNIDMDLITDDKILALINWIKENRLNMKSLWLEEI